GFGQFLNKKYFKAITFIVLEVMINLGGKVNTIIMESFLLHTKKAIEEANYLWLMFYPCIYLFAFCDAYKDACAHELLFMYIHLFFQVAIIRILSRACFLAFDFHGTRFSYRSIYSKNDIPVRRKMMSNPLICKRYLTLQIRG